MSNQRWILDTGWRRIFRALRPAAHADVDDEMAFHFRMRVEQFMAEGMTRDEAEQAARARYGDVVQVRSTLVGIDTSARRRLDWRERLHMVKHDIVVSLRSLAREPLFAMGVVLTLGLGIGANATMFGVIDGLMLRGPVGVVDARHVDRLYITYVDGADGPRTTSVVSYATLATLRQQARSFTSVGGYQPPYPRRLGTGRSAHDIPVASASWDLFRTLGVRPAVGRFFDASEDGPPDGAPVAIISTELWQTEFGGESRVIGKQIVIQDKPYTIIGVAPPGFSGADRLKTDVWLPLSLVHPRPDWPTTYLAQWVRVVGRLAPNVSPDKAAAEATRLLRGAYTGPLASMHELQATVGPLWLAGNGTVPAVASVARWLMGVAVAVLIIACANVTNLFVARTRRRRREIAVRVALGASRGALLRLLLTETTIVAMAGTVAALVVAWFGGQVMRVTLLSSIAWYGNPVDARVFAFTLAVAFVATIGVALVPTLEATRLDLTRSLKTGQQDGGGRRATGRATLSVVQSALCVVLLIGAALFIESLRHLRAVDLGFQPAQVLRVQVTTEKAIATASNWRDLQTQAFTDAMHELQRQPWVEHAAISVGTPYGYGFGVDVTIPGRDSLGPAPGGSPSISAVSSDFFATLGIPLRRGRTFTPDDRAGIAPVAIVGETMARLVWPGQDAIGKCLLIGGGKTPPPCSTVVGVVADVHRQSLREPPSMQYYVPLGQEQGIGGSVILVRPRVPMVDARTLLTRAMASMPRFAYTRISTIQEAIDPEFRPWQLGATMFGVFGLVALVVAAVGLYSVIAYLVENRTRELGVRLALGATAGLVMRDVIGRGIGTAFLGVIAGTTAALVAGRFVRPLLFEVTERDPMVLAGVACVVVVIAAVASWVPARRAARVDPIVALRAD